MKRVPAAILAALPGAPWQHWGLCLGWSVPVTPRAIRAGHDSLLSSSLLFFSFLCLPLSQLLNFTSGADFYSNSGLWEWLMLGCFHSDINILSKNAKYQKSVSAAGSWQPQESRGESSGHAGGAQLRQARPWIWQDFLSTPFLCHILICF